MRNFCTLFDSDYRAKGLVLHHTLMQHVGDFHLYILCLDDALHGLLSCLKLENTTLIRPQDFLDPALQSKKTQRSRTEWIWTMTPSLPLYCLENYPDIEEIAYVDADIAFFSNPQPMYDEIGDAPCMVIPHRFPPGRDKSENGLYNVSLVWWRHTPGMVDLLRTWRHQCLDWCHCWPSDGRFADQGYLNDWPEKRGAHVLEHLGCNLAPWNMGQYDYYYRPEEGLGIRQGDSIFTYELIFFHFHEFRIVNEWTHDFFRGHYARPHIIERCVYAPYEKMLGEQIERIRPYVQSTR
jgi:hypothetical protein